MQQTRFLCGPYFCNLAALHTSPLTLFVWVRAASTRLWLGHHQQTPMGKTNHAPPDTKRGARTLQNNLTKESQRLKRRHITTTTWNRGSIHRLRGELRTEIMSSADNQQNNTGSNVFSGETVSGSNDWRNGRSVYNEQSSFGSRNWNNFRQEPTRNEPWPSSHQPHSAPLPQQIQVRVNYPRTSSRDMQQNNTFHQRGGYNPPPISNTFQRATYYYQFGYANNQPYGSYGFHHHYPQQYNWYNPQRHYFQTQQIPLQNYGLLESQRNWDNGGIGDDRRYSTFRQNRILSTNVFPREWEEIKSAKSFTNQSGSDKGVKISVMCYNVLAPTLQKEHAYLYKECDPEAVKWSYRRRCFHKELELYRPDVVCLQEVEADLIQDYNHFFQQLGYKGLFKKRTGDKCDGCAIYFNDSKYNLVDSISVEYLQQSVPVLNRDNIGLVAKLETKCDSGHKFVVATTHLLFNLNRTDVKVAQGALLLAELDRIACYGIDENGSPLYYPTIVTGDFNSEPSFAVPQLMAEGQINLDKAFLSKAGKFGKSNSGEFLAQLGITQQCQHYELVQQRGQINPDMELHTSDSASHIYLSRSIHCGHDANFAEIFYSNTNSSSRSSNRQSSSSSTRNMKPLPVLHPIEPNNSGAADADMNNLQSEENEAGRVTHAFGLNDVYGFPTNTKDLDIYVTTKQNKWVRVDYIYYSTTGQINANGTRDEGCLKLLRRLRLPTSTECKKSGKIPHEGASSDHYPLLAEFLLTPPT